MAKDISMIVGPLSQITKIEKREENEEGGIYRGFLWKELSISWENQLLPPKRKGSDAECYLLQAWREGFRGPLRGLTLCSLSLAREEKEC